MIIFGAKRDNNLCGNASDFACMVRRQRAENVEGNFVNDVWNESGV